MSKNFKIDFIGVGIERCATSWIYNALDEHPGVCMSKYKEIDFFLNDEKYSKGIDYYASYFKHCETGVKGEFSPRYFFSKKALQRIKNDLPEVKLIISMRNPIDKTFSLYQMKKSYGLIEHSSFESFLKDDRYFKRAYYSEQLKLIFEIFDEDKILVLLYDDLKKSPDEFSRKLYSFLGVDEHFKSSLLYREINATSQKSIFERMVNTVLSKIKRKVFMKFKLGRNFVYKLEESGLMNKMQLFFARNKKSKINIKPMSDKTRQMLVSRLSVEIDEIGRLINRDLSGWKK